MVVSAEIIFARLLVPLMLGICCLYDLDSILNLYACAVITALIFLVLIIANTSYKFFAVYRSKKLIGSLFFLLFFFFGGLICLLKNDQLNPKYFGDQPYNQLKVWIADEPQIGNGTIRFTANVTARYLDGKLYGSLGRVSISIKTDTALTNYEYGDELIISASCTPLSPPFNPGEFDYSAWLALKNVYEQAFVSKNHVIKTGNNKGNTIQSYALKLRKSQIEIYKKIIEDKESFAVASTLILGYRADLSNETLAAYSKTGTIHALSVSGMHVGIIYVVLNYLLSFLDKKRKHRIIKVVIICSLIWFYSLLTGFSPSILRSAIMLTVYILAKSFNRQTNGYNILAFTACCMLFYNPFLIWDVGFQLSFLAVLGLIYLQPKIYKWFYFKHRLADWLWSSIALSVAAQVATFPLSIYYFHQFPLYFIFSNLFILIPITFLMYLGISILLFKLYFLAPIFEWLIIFMNDGLKWIAALPFAGVNQIWIDKTQLIALSLALTLGLIALANYKKYMLFVALAIFSIFQFSLALQSIQIQNQKKIVFFTTQKEYAVAFIYGQNAILVSHFKASDKNFKFYVQPALDQLRIQKMDLIKWDVDTNFRFFTKSNHQINFNGYRILLIDKYFDYKTIHETPIFNAVWLHQNPKIPIYALKRSVIFKTLIIDASNYSYNLAKFATEANKFQLQAHVLKKNKAYLVDLNKLPP